LWWRRCLPVCSPGRPTGGVKRAARWLWVTGMIRTGGDWLGESQSGQSVRASPVPSGKDTHRQCVERTGRLQLLFLHLARIWYGRSIMFAGAWWNVLNFNAMRIAVRLGTQPADWLNILQRFGDIFRTVWLPSGAQRERSEAKKSWYDCQAFRFHLAFCTALHSPAQPLISCRLPAGGLAAAPRSTRVRPDCWRIFSETRGELITSSHPQGRHAVWLPPTDGLTICSFSLHLAPTTEAKGRWMERDKSSLWWLRGG